MRNVCENVSSRLTDLCCRFWWNGSACSPLPATTTKLFSRNLSYHTFCSCLENLSTTNNLCIFWRSKLQQVSSHAFCSWDDKFTQKWNWNSPNNLCKCTDYPSTLLTITSTEWNLCLPWSNYLVTSFILEMNVGGFSEHQNKTSDTDRYKRYFFTAGVSQFNVETMKRIFEQRPELQVAKYLIVHVLSISYNVSRLELRMQKKATQQWSLRVANDILLNQVCVYHERLYAYNVGNKFWFVRCFSSQFTPKSLPKFLRKMCSRSVLRKAGPHPSLAK